MLFETEGDKTLEELREQWDDCHKCPIRSVKVCHGKGNPNAKIMVVGQSPTANEGHTGDMMTDPGGRSIKEWFGGLTSAVGISSDELYYSNVAKCPATIRGDINKPVHNINKDGTRGKAVVPAKECAEYLEDEIGIVKPNLIIAIGQKALRRFADYDPMKKIPKTIKAARGKIYDYRNYKFVCITMPIAISEQAEALLEEDFAFLMQVLTGKKQTQTYKPQEQKPLTLQDAFMQAATCTDCKLCNVRTHPVFGTGNTKADIMFVGEAPGYYEDKSGSPFVGNSGKLLHSILKSVGIDHKSVYITNAVKCWPGQGNPNPTDEEINACNKYIRSQVKSIKPKVIITLGRKALQAVAHYSGSVGKVRGTHLPCPFSDSVIIPTWHPAYVLRKDKEFGESNPIRKDFVEDIKQAKEMQCYLPQL